MKVRIDFIKSEKIFKSVFFDSSSRNPFAQIEEEISGVDGFDTIEFSTPKTVATKRIKNKNKMIDFIQYQIDNYRWI